MRIDSFYLLITNLKSINQRADPVFARADVQRADMRPQNGMFFSFITDNWNKRVRAGLGANSYDYDKNKETTRVISLIGQLHLR